MSDGARACACVCGGGGGIEGKGWLWRTAALVVSERRLYLITVGVFAAHMTRMNSKNHFITDGRGGTGGSGAGESLAAWPRDLLFFVLCLDVLLPVRHTPCAKKQDLLEVSLPLSRLPRNIELAPGPGILRHCPWRRALSAALLASA